MENYKKLPAEHQAAIEAALDTLARELGPRVSLANDDRAARAAEALATYIIESA